MRFLTAVEALKRGMPSTNSIRTDPSIGTVSRRFSRFGRIKIVVDFRGFRLDYIYVFFNLA